MRPTGWITMLLGLLMIVNPKNPIMKMCSCMTTIAETGTFAISIPLSIGLTFLVIGLTWIFYSTLVGLISIAVFVICLVLITFLSCRTAKKNKVDDFYD